MKVFILALLASLSFCSITQEHYHFHMGGLDARSQRQLMMDTGAHKGFFANTWCYLKNPANKQTRQACIDKANNKNGAQVSTTTTVHTKPATGRYLKAERRALVADFDAQVKAAHDACDAKHTSEQEKRRCLQALQREVRRNLAAIGKPSHRGFWGRFKCLVSHLFNKEQRETCYRDVQNADDSRNAELALNAQVNGNAAVKPAATTTTSVTTTTGSKRLLVEDRSMRKEFRRLLTWAENKCARHLNDADKFEYCVNAATRHASHKAAVGAKGEHKAFFRKFNCFVKNMFNKEKRQQCYADVDNAEANKNAALTLNAQAGVNAEKANPNPPANDPAPKTTVTTTTQAKGNATYRRLSASHKHVVDSTGCFFKYMFNSQKRAKCNADATAQRDASNKKSAAEKAAKKNAADKAAAEKRAKDEAEARAAEKRIGLDANGRARVSHSAESIVDGIYN